MDAYLFTVKDRQTGEVLCQGSAIKCADYIGCAQSYIRYMSGGYIKYISKAKTKHSRYKVERQAIGELKRGGAKKKDVTCWDCGTLMENVSAHRKRCSECQRKHTLKQKKRKMREIRNGLEQPKIFNKNKSGCEGCVYFFGDYEVNKCCNYIFIEDKRRPCPPGKDCTVRIERKGYREKEK